MEHEFESDATQEERSLTLFLVWFCVFCVLLGTLAYYLSHTLNSVAERQSEMLLPKLEEQLALYKSQWLMNGRPDAVEMLDASAQTLSKRISLPVNEQGVIQPPTRDRKGCEQLFMLLNPLPELDRSIDVDARFESQFNGRCVYQISMRSSDETLQLVYSLQHGLNAKQHDR
ncbi:hypothetical protein [Flocculibacter collagenilyticus]|uniref:hypothetical protein n=1 Tax=Flocculibacter collagenilyticus TaxID=2744479 RepID=UPI0018F32767|nr:hypothetical protein [Flocculibacter collagenilyticus]